jgi:hypothetical protein
LVCWSYCIDCCHFRGEEEFCGPAGDSPPSSNNSQRQQSHTIETRPYSADDVDALRGRVAELEAELLSGNQDIASENTTLDITLEINTPTPGQRNDQDAKPLRDAADPVIEDAASILEFLAWGRRKNPDYGTVVSPEAIVTGGNSGDICDSQQGISFPDDLQDSSQLSLLQLLMPSPQQVWQLVDYHQECLLWYHGSYIGPTFRKQVEDFYARFEGRIENSGVNLQWLALLFAVMTGSMTCAPTHEAISWGFRDPERETLSKRWFQAVISCLNRAEYTANQTILSVQAISTLTISAHMLGFSNMQSIHLASAVRIAQSLGLHRLNRTASGSIVDKEAGRRVWSQLCCQDWFSIPFSESYLINPLYSQSEKPMNCHDHDMVALPDNVPTITSYTRFLHVIASIMPRLQDGLMSCNTPFTKYEQVLVWDKRLRILATEERPLFLSNAPIEQDWPTHTSWARRSLAISSSHKIIMIHRTFLSESFTNPAFAFTRRTCLAASKTIIKEYKCVVGEDGPVIWVHQAFSVAASIILILDVLHRTPDEREYREHKGLVEDTVEILRRFKNSMIAIRGVRLLMALLAEVGRQQESESTNRKRRASAMDDFRALKKRRGFNVPKFVQTFCEGNIPSSERHIRGHQQQPTLMLGSPVSEPPSLPMGRDQPNFEHMMDGESLQLDSHAHLYLGAGLEGTSFENLLYLANHDFSII